MKGGGNDRPERGRSGGSTHPWVPTGRPGPTAERVALHNGFEGGLRCTTDGGSEGVGRGVRRRVGTIGIAVGMLVLGFAALAMSLRGSPPDDETLPDDPAPTAGTTPTSDVPVVTSTTEPPDGLDPERLLPSTERSVTAGCEEPVLVEAPASDLAQVVAGAPAGTCFELAAGTYDFFDVVPKDYMSFVGAGPHATVAVGTDDRENAFHGTAIGVTIAGLGLIDFQGDGGEKRQEQGAIRGTIAIWESNRGEMARDWLIEDVRVENTYANGVLLGDDFTIRNSSFIDNGVTGLAGSETSGGLIEANLIVGNGFNQADGYLANGGGMKFTQVISGDNPLIVRGNHVYENDGIGIWCDIACNGFHVLDNYIHDQSSRAVMFELSSGGLIRGNVMIDANGWSDFRRDFNAGAVTVGESSDVVVEDNYIEGAVAGIIVRQTERPVRPVEDFLDNYANVTFVSGDVTIRNNLLADVELMGLSTGLTGEAVLDAPETIEFTGNRYAQPDAVRFWWQSDGPLTLDEWQQQGRDTGAEAFERPVWVAELQASVTATTPGIDDPGAAVLEEVQPVEVPIRIDSGGDGFSDDEGRTWAADQFYVDGEVASHAAGIDILETEDDDLYRTERWGLDGYQIPVESGRYLVRLHHAEVYEGCQAEGCRRFSVEVEGVVVESAIDLFETVGGYRPLVLSVEVEVTDGWLDVSFGTLEQSPQIAGLEVLAADA